ncbi:MAG TPA: response regulator transcription factor [Actinomycetota bacterium]|nr:response regulator transcription factor [Actinomycetota bacterium]
MTSAAPVARAERRTHASPRLPSDTARRARVAIVDPHPCFALGLERLLASCDSVSVVAAADALERRGPVPDVVLADVPALAPASVRVVERLVCAGPTVRLAVFTSSRSMTAFRRALDLGARAYIPKTATLPELVDAVRRVAAGEVVLGPLLSLDAGQSAPAPPALESAETMILSLLAEGLDNDEIARRLHMSGSSLTRRLRAIVTKLDARNRLHAVVLAARLGYIEL